jgi:chromosome segregation ATPase
MNAKDVSLKLKISLRMVQKYCNELNIHKHRNRFVITENDLQRIKDRHHSLKIELQQLAEAIEKNRTEKETNESVIEANESEDVANEYRTEYYTDTEYAEVQKRIIEYNKLNERIADLKNEVQYLRNSLDKQSEQMNVLLNSFNNTIASIRERNAIEYKNTIDPE